MLNKFYGYLADRMIARRIVTEDDREVVVYGLDMFIYTIASLGALVCLGAIFGLAAQTALLLLLEIPIQSFGGGYHARTHLKCFMWMLLFWGLCMMLYVYMPALGVYLLSIPTYVVLWIFPPIEHVNAPSTEAKKVRMRRNLRIYLTIIAIVMVVCTLHNASIAKIIALAILDCGISVVMGLFSKDTVPRHGVH